jgi:hypothetical protein
MATVVPAPKTSSVLDFALRLRGQNIQKETARAGLELEQNKLELEKERIDATIANNIRVGQQAQAQLQFNQTQWIEEQIRAQEIEDPYKLQLMRESAARASETQQRVASIAADEAVNKEILEEKRKLAVQNTLGKTAEAKESKYRIEALERMTVDDRDAFMKATELQKMQAAENSLLRTQLAGERVAFDAIKSAAQTQQIDNKAKIDSANFLWGDTLRGMQEPGMPLLGEVQSLRNQLIAGAIPPDQQGERVTALSQRQQDILMQRAGQERQIESQARQQEFSYKAFVSNTETWDPQSLAEFNASQGKADVRYVAPTLKDRFLRSIREPLLYTEAAAKARGQDFYNKWLAADSLVDIKKILEPEQAPSAGDFNIRGATPVK